MSEAHANPGGEGGAPAQAAVAATSPRWREIWQVPALLVAGGLLVSGMVYAVKHAPKPEVGGDIHAAAVMEKEGRYGEAIETLNTKVLPKLAKAASPEERREFHLIRARSLYKGQRELGINRPENNRNVIREYDEAVKINATLEEMDRWFLANAHLDEGEVEESLRYVGELTDAMKSQRTEIVQRIVTQSMEGKHRNESRALDLLNGLLSDRDAEEQVKLWAIARQISLLVRQGYSEDAITKAVRSLVGLDRASGNEEVRGEVHVALARAYVAVGDRDHALSQLEVASQLLGDEHPLMASVELLRAGVEREQGEEGLLAAKDRYAAIIERFGYSPEVAGALLGLAELDTRLSRERPELLEDAFVAYERLVGVIQDDGELGETQPQAVAASLLARYREQFEQGQNEQAMRFAELAERVAGRENAGADVYLALAEVHKRTAEKILLDAAGTSAITLANVDPATQREARTHFVASGEYYRRHAAKVVQTDNGAYGQSLWFAADAFDRAGDLDASVTAFQQFVLDFPSDLRNAEARFRLAQAFQARGDLELAAKSYRAIIEGREVDGTGSWADASIVPLAQTFLLDGDQKNDEEAERLLTGVVAGSVGGTRTDTFRAALLELGEYYYLTQQFERSIERFEEYLQRAEKDGVTDRVNAARYKLADSYRLSSHAIAQDLKGEDRPEGERRDLEQKRIDRLLKATAVYEEVGATLAAIPNKSAIEELYERNSAFYMGDCAFDLKDYDVAIRYYDGAKERYPRDPAALVAMIQIVNALVAQGQLDRAQTANARAKRFYESLPESVWDDPTLPMSRRDWERWLDSQVTLGTLASSGAGG
ncbi:MAG: tetratricopeptide repeat protein [Phycisphaerales bacterium]